MAWDIFKKIFVEFLFLGSTFLITWSVHNLIPSLKKHKLEKLWGFIVALIGGFFVLYRAYLLINV